MAYLVPQPFESPWRNITQLCLLVAAFGAAGLAGCATPDRSSVPPLAETRFFQKVERGSDQGGFYQEPEAIRTIAATEGLIIPPAPAAWQRMLESSRTFGIRSRHALLKLAMDMGKPFLIDAFKAYAGRSDPFTECGVLSMMIQQMPADPSVPRYSIELLERLRGARFPEGIDLHGNTPFDVVKLSVDNLWELPEGRQTDDDLLRWARKAGSSQHAWQFNGASRKWQVAARKEAQ